MKLYLIGGFLGSGKTTAIRQACLLLQQQVRVGVITNDQGEQLVDSAFIQAEQVPTREVTNGCFCCNYTNLEKSIQSLSGTERPEIIFAESVGSCTDLIATVVNPLMQFHPRLEIVVSVFADAHILLHQEKNHAPLFEAEVEYIFQKQLDEADVLVVNKIDLLQEEELKALKTYLQAQYSGKKILFQNSLTSDGIQPWLSCLQQFQLLQKRASLEVDYQIYGKGEAKLGWLDEEVEIITTDNRAVEAANGLINKIYSQIREGEYRIGHLKFLLNDGQRKRKISFVSLQGRATMFSDEGPVANKVKLLINARVQTEPAILKEIIATAIHELKREMACKVIERKMLAFKPGFPKPTHRILS
jgi:Ni2+-binding GTPase involved in maturation of urease and hydrogenase